MGIRQVASIRAGAVADLMRDWSLEAAGEPFSRTGAGLVAPVRARDGGELVLRIFPVAEWASHAADALAYWSGCGAVRLVAVERELGALLMERVIPGTSLVSLCASDDHAATAAAASVIAELRAAPGTGAVSLPDVTSWTGALQPAGAGAMPSELRTASSRAAALSVDLLADAPRSVLHGDLQHYNVLAAGRGSWLAIDPKGLLGPREAESAALLRNPRGFVLSHARPRQLLADRVAVLEERLGDDRRLLMAWGYVLAVVAAAWAFEDHERDSDVRRWLACADLLRP